MKYQTILFFILIATIFSAVLAFSETQLLCGIDDGCTVVQSSSYSNFFGIENAVIGLFAFIIVGILIALMSLGIINLVTSLTVSSL